MPTVFTFDGGVSIGPAFTSATPNPYPPTVTITALIDDGSVAPGDEVRFTVSDFFMPTELASSGLNFVNMGPDPANPGAFIYEAVGFYHGTYEFFGPAGLEKGFVFGPNIGLPGAGSPDGFLILFDDDFNIFHPALLNSIQNYNNFPTPPITENACFVEGTLIRTPLGEVPVEALSIGQPVMTADGGSVPVKWIGRQVVRKVFGGPVVQPVRIRSGALAEGVPLSDLTVSADHGMIVDGLVINAGALVNGSTIAFVPVADLPAAFTYYHVEIEDHDVILANGAPAETFIDYVGRQAFDNHAEYVALYGCERIIPEMTRPRISTARLVPEAIRARLAIGMHRGSAREMLIA
ncbi:MAG: hypothetical protein CMH66_10385 [Nioella sp.]|nr:hypothetical protein [Nioella sp.]